MRKSRITRDVTASVPSDTTGGLTLDDLRELVDAVYPGAGRTDGTTWTDEDVAAVKSRPQCRYRREGKRWVRGCLDRFPERRSGPNRAERRKGRRGRRRHGGA